MEKLLAADEGEPAIVENKEGRGPFVFVCEHASALLPVSLGTLGLNGEALKSHIAWDPGALAVSQILSGHFDAPLVYQRYSRLAYDCNRPPESPAAMPVKSEIYAVPGNAAMTPANRDARIKEIYEPFHAAIREVLNERRNAGVKTVLVTMHTFTPVYFGKKRDVEIGILHDSDARMADAMIVAASTDGPFDLRRNEPYGPQDGVTHTLKLHGVANGLQNVMIEIRNDRVRDATEQGVAADYIAGLLLRAVG
ncbi:N-formylglutamate amidohydrolase [Rhizobium sp. L1K21]|uniref:N-formylglutamate amidohydrolase n=1 Tax=Rhizobium sp. L1K21 TaxID=2954933 RepID=UPI003592EE53